MSIWYFEMTLQILQQFNENLFMKKNVQLKKKNALHVGNVLDQACANDKMLPQFQKPVLFC